MTNPNDSAYPNTNSYSSIPFTKREIVLKDFMCAIVSTLHGSSQIKETIANDIAKEALILTEAYFNELNK